MSGRSETKKERALYIRTRADELARSGKYSSYLQIEHAILAEGYVEAREVLGLSVVRNGINELLDIARLKGEGK